MEATLLVVDDEDSIREALQEYLARQGFTVATARDGVEALDLLDEVCPDLILLDVCLPHADGVEVCLEVRRRAGHSIGIIMMSEVRTEAVEQVVGLEVGADMYLIKPVEPRLLLAQVRALLRRMRDRRAEDRQQAGDWLYKDDHLRLADKRRHVEVAGLPVHLPPIEFGLLQYLARRPGVACSRHELLKNVWPPGEVYESADQVVDQRIYRLRQEIEPDPAHPRYILTVHGIGYRFRAP